MSQEPQGNDPGLKVIVMKDVLCRVQEEFPNSSLTFVDQGRIERAIWTLSPLSKDRVDPRKLIELVLSESFWIPERVEWLEVAGSLEVTRVSFVKPKNTWSAARS